MLSNSRAMHRNKRARVDTALWSLPTDILTDSIFSFLSRQDISLMATCSSKFAPQCLFNLTKTNHKTYLATPRHFVHLVRICPDGLRTIARTYMELSSPEGILRHDLTFHESLPYQYFQSITCPRGRILAEFSFMPQTNLRILDVRWPQAVQRMANLLPGTVETLHLRGDFDMELMPGELPASLRTLSLGNVFNSPISCGVLPPCLQYFSPGKSFSHGFCPGVLPGTLQTLILKRDFRAPITVGVLPNQLKNLVVANMSASMLIPGCLPESLLSLWWHGTQQIMLTPGLLPQNLKMLEISHVNAVEPMALPRSLKFLLMVICQDSLVLKSGLLPEGIEDLRLLGGFNQTDLDATCFPTTLKSLEVGDMFNSPIRPGTLPKGLNLLIFGGRFNQDLEPHSLPEDLERLIFGDLFNKPLRTNVIPANLDVLDVGEAFDQPLSRTWLPDEIRRLYVNWRHYPDIKDGTAIGHPHMVVSNQTGCSGLGWLDEYRHPYRE